MRENFSEYITLTKERITSERIAAGLPHDAQTIEMNAPFELLPKMLRAGTEARPYESPATDENKTENGVLLIHGFLDSPYTLRSIAKIYQQQGFLVRAILLPGHGSDPHVLEKTKIKHWRSTVYNAIKALQKNCEHVHLCGFSLGGAIAYLASRKHNIASLCLLAPAFEISAVMSVTLPFVTHISKQKWFRKLQWVNIKDQPYNAVRYNEFPLQAAQHVNQIVRKVQAELRHKPIKCPLFIGMTLEDETVRFRTIYKAFKKATNTHKKALCFTSKKFVFKQPNIEFETMKNSHIGLPVSPSDPMLGKMATENATKADLHYHRLTYNPKFDVLAKSIQQWLKALS